MVAEIAGFLREFCFLGSRRWRSPGRATQAILIGSLRRLFELPPLGGEIGQRRGQLREQALGAGERGFSFRNPLVDAAAHFDARLDLVLEFAVFDGKPLQRHLGVDRLLLLAFDIGRKLCEPAFQFGDAFFRARFLAVQQFARIGQPLQPGRGAGFGLAQRRQFGGADGLDACGFRLFAGALGHLADTESWVRAASPRRHGPPASADGTTWPRPCAPWRRLRGTDRLPRLLLQAVDLAGQLADHVFDAGEVGLGRLEAQFGLMAAGVKAGDAGGIFQHAAALLGLRLNDFADLALVDQGRRTAPVAASANRICTSRARTSRPLMR